MRLLILSIITAGSFAASGSASCFNGDEHQIASDIFAVSVGDVDGDGRADVVYKRPNGPSSWYYVTFSNEQNGSTSHEDHYIVNPLGNTLIGHASLVEDLDQDGDMDILVINYASVEWYRNPGTVGDQWTTESLSAAGPDGCRSLHTADVDRDGHIDLFVGCHGSGISWWRGIGDGAFELTQTLPESTPPVFILSLQSLDVNGDGYLDLLVGEDRRSGVDYFSWYQFDPEFFHTCSRGAFVGRHVISQSTVPREILVTDINGDGSLDVVTGTGNGVWWYEVPANSTDANAWIRRAIGPTDAKSVWIALADISGNGNTDLLATTPADDTIVGWYEHEDGAGSFSEDAERITAEVHQYFSYPTRSVFSIDVDHDGRLDVVYTAGYDSRSLYWKRNSCAGPCEPGFYDVIGDVPKWGVINGRGGGEILTNCSECALLCVNEPLCVSYECSPTTRECNLNNNTEYVNGQYMDFNLCIKE